jgi:hypothetical protein
LHIFLSIIKWGVEEEDSESPPRTNLSGLKGGRTKRKTKRREWNKEKGMTI